MRGKGLEPVKTKKKTGNQPAENGKGLKKEDGRDTEECDGVEEEEDETQTSEATLEK